MGDLVRIADLAINSPFRVFDIRTQNYIYSVLNPSDFGDIPFDIAVLPVFGLRSVDNVLYIDVDNY